MEIEEFPKYSIGDKVLYSQSAEYVCPKCHQGTTRENFTYVEKNQNLPGTVISGFTKLKMQCLHCLQPIFQEGYIVSLETPMVNQLEEEFQKVLANPLEIQMYE